MAKTARLLHLDSEQTTPGGNATLDLNVPYTVSVGIMGSAPILFHRWNVEAVEEKARAAKGSRAKKSDDTESYLYRNDAREICIPGEYLRQSIIGAAKFQQDPRSPRKSAMDLFKAGVVALTQLASLRTKEPDYLDKRRVQVQRNGITRVRPAMNSGWKAQFEMMINIPQYIPEIFLQQVVGDAGRLIGLGDFRPTYGRFTVVDWTLLG